MGATRGSNGRVLVNGYEISEYLRSFGLDMSLNVIDVSSFLISAKKHITGQEEGTGSGEGFWEGGTDKIDDILASIKRAEAIWSYYPAGYAAGNRGYSFRAIETAYNISNTIDDAIRFSVACQANKKIDSVISLCGLTTKSASGPTTAVDLGAGSENGGTIYFHTTTVSGTVDVEIEDSADGTTWATLATLEVGEAGAQRIEVDEIDRYARATVTLSTGESITFQAGIHIN